MFYRYGYYPAPPPIQFQGTKEALAKKLAQTGLQVVGGGNGTYVLGGTSSGVIYEFLDETSQSPIRSIVPSKDMLRLRYYKERITEKDYERLANDLNKGLIKFDDLAISPRF